MLRFLGNSITLHAPSPQIGWTGNWGMAASAPEKDYVHLLVDSLKRFWGTPPEIRVENIADFERHYPTYDPSRLVKKHQEFKPDVVIVAIGENVPALNSEDAKSKFKEKLTGLFSGLKHTGKPELFVRSCFWPDKTKDDLLRAACTEIGGVFVDISPLAGDESSYARSERTFHHAGVAAHPGDKGMQAIADLLRKAIEARFQEKVPKEQSPFSDPRSYFQNGSASGGRISVSWPR